MWSVVMSFINSEEIAVLVYPVLPVRLVCDNLYLNKVLTSLAGDSYHSKS